MLHTISFVGIALVLFPLAVAYRAWKNGHRNWTVILLMSIPLALGFFAALLALFQTGKSLPQDVKCPNCGNEATVQKMITVEKETGEQLQGIYVVGVHAILFFNVVFLFIGIELLTGSRAFTYEGLPDKLVGVLLIAVNAGFIFRNIGFVYKYFTMEKVRICNCQCQECVHTWTWQSGKLPPTVDIPYAR